MYANSINSRFLARSKSVCIALFVAFAFLYCAHGQPSAFTYQGHLAVAGTSANGFYDFQAYLQDSASNSIAGPLIASTTISNGLFGIVLDFGSASLTGQDRWLQLAVRTNGSGAFTPLFPRQQIASAPYAIRAANYGGAVADSQLSPNIPRLNGDQAFSGTVQFNNASNGFKGSFTGNGSSLGSLNATALTSGTLADARLSPNVALRTGGNAFSGTQTITNGNLGIGTAVPGAQLALGDALPGTIGSRVTDYSKQLYLGGEYNTGYNASNSVKLYISQYDNDASDIFPIYVEDENNNVDFYLRASNNVKSAYFGINVGLGYTSPNYRLSLGNDNANTKLAVWDGGAGTAMGLGVGPGQFRFHLPDSNNRFSFLNSAGGNELFTIKGNGSVGIGTSNPAESLEVRGNIKLGATNELFAAGGPDNLRIVRGIIQVSAGTATVYNGSGFSVVRESTGNFSLTFSPPFADVPSVTPNVLDGGPLYANLAGLTASAALIVVRTGTTVADPAYLMFTAIGTR